MGSGAVEREVRGAVSSVLESESFRAWLASEGLAAGDLVALNNSFVYRDTVKTRKHSDYLLLKAAGGKRLDKTSLGVSAASSFNVDFKVFTAKSRNLPAVRPLGPCVSEQVASLGTLVFVLIGEIDLRTECEVAIGHSLLKTIRLRTVNRKEVTVEGDAIEISRFAGLESLWHGLEKEAVVQGLVEGVLPQNLELPLAEAYERLQAEAYAAVKIPTDKIKSIDGSILGHLAATLKRQSAEYEESLTKCGKDGRQSSEALNNVLRIAYNFASDAKGFIELIVSICDLKPVLQWMTLGEHFQLAEAFRRVPWVKSKKKPSLSLYVETVAGARNHAFHDLLPFDRSLHVDLGNVSLKAQRLQLFSSYSRKKDNLLEYEDQEIVDLLTGFTRAPETTVAFSFWERNLEVMRATEELIGATARALMALRKARR
jgi:hypothetical protein